MSDRSVNLNVAAAAILSALACMANQSGCAETRKPLDDAELASRRAAWEQQQENLVLSVSNRMVDRARQEYDEHQAGRAPAPVLDILVLSGGGDYGAYGAGLLNGWGTVTDPSFKRPKFDVVTGVSTGALIAPFAFADTDQSYERIETLYRNPKSDWIRPRGLLFFLPGNRSLVKIDGLRKSLEKAVNAELIRTISEQADTERVLMIAATNQDLGRQTVFDLGAEAEAAQRTHDIERFHSMMLASSAIPAVFPPVEIDGTLYGDGGVTANVLVEWNLQSPRSVISVWRERYPGVPPPLLRYWIIFNNQAHAIPQTVQPEWLHLAARSLEILLRSSTIAEFDLVAEDVNELNESGLGRGEVWLNSIPDSWRAPVEGTFKKKTMDSLADLGRKEGANQATWRLLTKTRADK